MSVAEFFKRNRQVAGFTNPARSVYQTVKELVENALDATETHGILPDIKLLIDIVDRERGFIRITVEDNGIGIPPSKVPYAFARVLYGSKYVERQTRGLFGLGVKAAVLYAQMTTNEPIIVETTPIGDDKRYRFVLKINIKKNEPIVLEKKVLKANGKHGTRVAITIQGDWGRARGKVLDYIARTHVICPYASFYVRYPDSNGRTKVLRFPRASEKLPPPPKEIKPHPHGVDVETFKHLVEQARPGTTLLRFLTYYFSGVGENSARRFLQELGLSPKRSVKGLRRDEIVKIVHAMKRFKWRAPPSSALSPVGEENIIAGLRDMYKPEFAVAVTRPPRVYRGHPFIVEVGLAYGGRIEPSNTPILLRFANKIPLLYDEGVDVTYKAVNTIEWRRYHVEFPAPLVVLVHIAGTKIPFHGLGKEAVADEPEIEQEVKLAVMDAARRLATYISRKRRELAVITRKITLLKYGQVIAHTLAQALGEDEKAIMRMIEETINKKLVVSS